MVHEVCGCFETKEEAARVINALSLKGFPADKIKVFTAQTDPADLGKETDGFIMNVREDANRRPTSRFKRLFGKISDSDTNIHSQLRDFGLSERQVEKYTHDIRAGNVLVLADNKLKMGHHHTTNVEFGMESPLVHHSRQHE